MSDIASHYVNTKTWVVHRWDCPSVPPVWVHRWQYPLSGERPCSRCLHGRWPDPDDVN